ncbi:TetR/AcrR family transcriptional regulator [Alteromonas sp. ASW11-19]|uniref:TetR/AcrR family transcriptional regulator n=1 Tax=Alteromonas salexigens TaxID=2982530 RepID=A0ABT2VPM4_9ALTE|nr:TetR/AcrR family transcriptional regulator [Alteromonas salexigens]MCU7553874.1 TetR/AcrR family transcriptional regulator [Alteromonas salexigens]
MSTQKVSDAGVGAKNRARILTAAEKAFASHGLKGTSVQQIADEAGLPKTNVLYYFKTKLALYLTILEDTLALWNSHFDQATADDDPADALASYIAEKMELSRTRPLASKIFAMEILNGAPNLTAYFEEEHTVWMRSRTAVIQAWIDQGKMQPVAPEYLLFTIWGSTQHYADFAAQITHLRGPMRKEEFRQATRDLVRLILTGCGLAVPEQYQVAEARHG